MEGSHFLKDLVAFSSSIFVCVSTQQDDSKDFAEQVVAAIESRVMVRRKSQ